MDKGTLGGLATINRRGINHARQAMPTPQVVETVEGDRPEGPPEVSWSNAYMMNRQEKISKILTSVVHVFGISFESPRCELCRKEITSQAT